MTVEARRRLVLVRHAKSDWPEGVPDHDRPLGNRGRRDARALGGWLAAARVAPDLVVVSTAARARQTWELAGDALGAPTRVTLDDRAYASSADELLSVVRGTPASVGALVLVGHNPGTHELAVMLEDGTGFGADRLRLHTSFPTSAVAVLDALDPDWGGVGAGGCRLAVFATPRG